MLLMMRGMSMMWLLGGVASRLSRESVRSTTTFEPDGIPLCPVGLRMIPTFHYAHTNGYRALRYRCPLLFPEATGQTCEHEQFRKRERMPKGNQ